MRLFYHKAIRADCNFARSLPYNRTMPLDLSRIDAILFDLDGTIRDTDDQYVGRVAGLLRPIAFLLPKRDATRLARWLVMLFEGPVNRLLWLADKIGLDPLIHKLFHIANPWRRRASGQAFFIVPGAEDCLTELGPRYPLGLVTTRGEGSTRAFLRGTGMEAAFGSVVSGLTTRRGKPSPDPLLHAAAELGVPIERCLMVGDTVVDMIAARRAGAQAVGLLSGFGEEDELLARGADLLLPSVAELPAALAPKAA
jgi:phosphoglycolate phosphatase-like HAD superfamily hydrolase